MCIRERKNRRIINNVKIYFKESNMSEKDKNKLRRQINIRLEQELYDFLVEYSKKEFMTVTAVVRAMIAKLYKEEKNPIVRD